MALHWGPGGGVVGAPPFFPLMLFRPAPLCPWAPFPSSFLKFRDFGLSPSHPPGEECSVGLHLGQLPSSSSASSLWLWQLLRGERGREGRRRGVGRDSADQRALGSGLHVGRDGWVDIDAPGSHGEWGRGGWGRGRQGFLRFALLGQKCLKQWGTCHPTPTLSLPQPPTHTYTHTHTRHEHPHVHPHTQEGNAMLPARAVSFPADQVFPRGWRAWRSILSPVHVPARPTGALGCPCCLCLCPLPLSPGV